ncbi:hypothetical protein JCM10450v2_003160 [Rhodotorula kratochvilovae]
MADLTSQRRGSAASSVSVTIETTTTTTAATPYTAPVDESTHTTVSPCPPSRRAASFPSDALTLPYAFPPPPPYTFPHVGPPRASSIATVHPLSFFPFHALTPLPSASHLPLPAPASVSPPPLYASTPRTQAERLFWYGFLLPLLWLAGARRIWASERPAGFAAYGGGATKDADADAEAAVAVALDVREAQEMWREEELVWAKRCAWALAAAMGAALIFGMAIASVLGAW